MEFGVNLPRWGLKPKALQLSGVGAESVKIIPLGIKNVQTLPRRSTPASLRIKFPIMSAAAGVLALKSGAHERSGGLAAR